MLFVVATVAMIRIKCVARPGTANTNYLCDILAIMLRNSCDILYHLDT